MTTPFVVFRLVDDHGTVLVDDIVDATTVDPVALANAHAQIAEASLARGVGYSLIVIDFDDGRTLGGFYVAP